MTGRPSPVRQHIAYKIALAAALCGSVCLLIWLAYKLALGYRYGSPGSHDFIQYWSAGQLLLSGGNPYDSARLQRVQLQLGSPRVSPVYMWNPPWLLVWLMPLLMMTFEHAAITWLPLNAALVLLSAVITWRSQLSAAERPTVAAPVACVTFVPIYFALKMGQVSCLLLLGAAGFLFAVVRRKDLLAGVLLSLTSIKPHVVYLVWIVATWWVVVNRRWKVLAGFLLVLAPSLLALTLIWPAWYHAYYGVVTNPPLYWPSSMGPPVLGAVVRELTPLKGESLQYIPSALVGAVTLLWLAIRRPEIDWRVILSPILLLSVPTAAYGWPFDHTILLIPFLQIIGWLIERGGQLTGWKPLTAALLAGTLGTTLALSLARATDFNFFWVPWALGLIYLYTHVSRRRSQRRATSREAQETKD